MEDTLAARSVFVSAEERFGRLMSFPGLAGTKAPPAHVGGQDIPEFTAPEHRYRPCGVRLKHPLSKLGAGASGQEVGDHC